MSDRSQREIFVNMYHNAIFLDEKLVEKGAMEGVVMCHLDMTLYEFLELLAKNGVDLQSKLK